MTLASFGLCILVQFLIGMNWILGWTLNLKYVTSGMNDHSYLSGTKIGTAGDKSCEYIYHSDCILDPYTGHRFHHQHNG